MVANVLDCSLLIDSQLADGSNQSYNDTNDTTIEIWLDEDTTSIFDPDLSFNTPSFWIGFILTLFILILISVITSCIYYPYFDKRQKEIKLRTDSLYAKDDITPYLDPYTEYNQDLEGVIFDYANIFKSSFVNLESTITSKKPLYQHFIEFILISSLLFVGYIQIYLVINHWTDSYWSYLKTECHHTDSQHIYQVNMDKLCVIDDVLHFNDYEFKFYANFDANITDNFACYVDKHHYTVRATVYDWQCECCGRCGNGCKAGRACNWGEFDQNGCGYALCIIAALASIIASICCCVNKLYDDLENKYEIEIKSNEKSKSKECLLELQEI